MSRAILRPAAEAFGVLCLAAGNEASAEFLSGGDLVFNAGEGRKVVAAATA